MKTQEEIIEIIYEMVEKNEKISDLFYKQSEYKLAAERRVQAATLLKLKNRII